MDHSELDFFSLHKSENTVSHILHEKTAMNKLVSLISLIEQKKQHMN